MKVAIVAQPYDAILPPRQTSLGLIAYHTAMEMGRHAEVTLYARRRRGVAIPQDLPFRVSFVSSVSDDALQYAAAHYPRWAGRLGIAGLADAHAGYARAVCRKLERSRPDVVHVMNYWSWCPRFRKRAPDRRIVLSMHAEWLSQGDPKQVGPALAATDAIVAVSDHIARLVRASFPGYPGEVVTAHNGVNAEQFRPAPKPDHGGDGALRVLFVGRVSPEKGVHTLIEAFAQVASRIDRARLDIVGGRSTLRQDFIVGISADPLVRALERFYDGSAGAEYQQYLDGLVGKHGLTGKVRFSGHVPHRELPDRYRASAVVVNPSLSESFGISLVEGMACGLPVVGTRVGGMVETVVDGETGLLVEPEQPAALADAIVSLLQDAARSRRMGASGRARAVARFSWGARADKLLATYRMVLGRDHA